MAAWPLLVVASAWNPSDASNAAEPRSHALGMSSGRPPVEREEALGLLLLRTLALTVVSLPRRIGG